LISLDFLRVISGFAQKPRLPQYMHEKLRGSTLEVLEVTGHCAHMSHPHLVTAAMQRYLSLT